MSLKPVSVRIERDVEVDDGYGGVSIVPVIVYGDLQATINYPAQRPDLRAEAGAGGGAGPGVATRYLGLVTFEPKPDALILVNDRILDTSAGERHKVVSVRGASRYEFTLQLDVELLA